MANCLEQFCGCNEMATPLELLTWLWPLSACCLSTDEAMRKFRTSGRSSSSSKCSPPVPPLVGCLKFSIEFVTDCLAATFLCAVIEAIGFVCCFNLLESVKSVELADKVAPFTVVGFGSLARCLCDAMRRN